MNYVLESPYPKIFAERICILMKKYYLFALVVVAAALLVAPPPVFASYWNEGKDGDSEASAYVIDSLQDLKDLQQRVNNGTEPAGKFYRQTKDITISTSDSGSRYWNAIGYNEERPFKGHYNGDFSIVKAVIDESLFGYVKVEDGYAIKNLDFEGEIKDTDSDLGRTRGGIASWLINGSIENCNVRATIEYKYYYYHPIAGGIVAIVESGGSVKNSSFSGTISCGMYYTEIDEVNYLPKAGGIVGYLKGGSIEKCLATFKSAGVYAYHGGEGSTTDAPAYAGGIVGEVDGESSKVINCVAQGKVNSTQYSGGIVGYMTGGTLTACNVLGSSDIIANESAGGIAGHLGQDGVISGDKIVMTSSVMARHTAAGGIVGDLQSGTVKGNWAYTVVKGDARYKGAIIGRARGSNTYSDNVYGTDIGVTETSDTDATSHEEENLTPDEQNPIDTTLNQGEVAETEGTPSTPPEPSEPGDDPTPGGEDSTASVDVVIKPEAGTLIEVTLDFEANSQDILDKLSITDGLQIQELTTDATTPRAVDQVSTQESQDIANSGQVIVVVLPTIKVDEAKVYVWKVKISEATGLKVDAPIALRLSAGTDDDFNAAEITASTGVLLDDEGNTLTTLPADRNVNIAAYLEADTTYAPIITTSKSGAAIPGTTTTPTTTTTSDDKSGDDSSSGCATSSLSGILGLVIMAGALGFKKSR